MSSPIFGSSLNTGRSPEHLRRPVTLDESLRRAIVKLSHESSRSDFLDRKAAAILAFSMDACVSVVAKASAKKPYSIKSRTCCWKQSKLEWQAMTMQEFGPKTAKGCCYGF